MGLVDYDSDSETDLGLPLLPDHRKVKVIQKDQSENLPRNTQKRPLPSLPDTFNSGVGPKDDPALHQGRKRTRPYVEGDYDTHIYLSLPLPPKVKDEIKIYETNIRAAGPDMELHSFLNTSRDLHVSLTHAFPLRRYQIAPFKARLSSELSKISLGGFRLSLAGRVKVYYNGKRFGGDGHGGRAFLALRVGAGVKEIDEIVNKVLHPILRDFHRPLYHSNPEYHASFAWCLTDPSPTADLDLASNPDPAEQEFDALADQTRPAKVPIPDSVIDDLNTELEARIVAAQSRNGWQIDSLILKTGKEVTEMSL